LLARAEPLALPSAPGLQAGWKMSAPSPCMCSPGSIPRLARARSRASLCLRTSTGRDRWAGDANDQGGIPRKPGRDSLRAAPPMARLRELDEVNVG
jgi:hypothetical protein